MKTAVRIFTIFDIPIEINYSWFIIFSLVFISLSRGYFPLTLPGFSSLSHWILGAIATILLFTCLLIHELSHSYVAIKYGLPIHGITLFIFGGVAHMEKEPSSPKVEFQMAIAGPIASLVLSAFFFLLAQIFYFTGTNQAAIAISTYLFVLNLIIAVFNMIPGFPLDGGRVLRATIWHYTHDFKQATHVASNLGKGFAFFLMAFGLFSLIKGSFISGLWLIFIGLFVQEAADISYKQVLMKKALEGVRITDIMTKNVITVSADLPLDKLVDDYFFRFRFSSFPVISSNDQLVGIITLHDVKEIPREKWPISKTSDHMTFISEKIIAHQNTNVMAVLPKMAKNDLGRLLIIENNKLIGILSHRDINRLYEFKNDLGK